MTAITLAVYDAEAPATKIADLASAYGKLLRDDITNIGSGRLQIRVDAAEVVAGLFDADNIVRVAFDGTDRFAWLVDNVEREGRDGADQLTVSGPGILAVLAGAAVHPEYTTDGAVRPGSADTRVFGWMAAAYDDSAWGSATELGTQASPPAITHWDGNPDGWPDPGAYWIWSDAGAQPGDQYCFFRREFTVGDETPVIIYATADDSFDLYLDGEKVLGAPTQRMQWTRTFATNVITLESGAHTLAARAYNMERPYGDNPAGLLVSVMQASAEGVPLQQNEVQEVYNDAGFNEVQEVSNDSTMGTFTLSFGGFTTNAIAHDAAAATIEAELEALPDITDVTVSGTGDPADPWVVTFIDPGQQNVATLSADDTNMDGTTTVTVTQDGGNGGTFTLTFNGQTTAAMDWNASASTIKTGLEALSNVDEVAVTGSGLQSDPWVVEFTGEDVAHRDWPVMTADDSSLTGDGTNTTTINETQNGNVGSVVLHSDSSWLALETNDPPGMTAGEILRILREEAQTRGAIPDVSDDFTDDVDSDGNAWTELDEFACQVGNDTVLTVALRLGDYGVDVHMSPTQVLSAYEGRGVDRSATVTLTRSDCSNGPKLRYDQSVVTALLARTAAGWVEDEVAGATRRVEGFLSLGAIPTLQGAAQVMANSLTAFQNARQIIDPEYPDTAGKPVPYADFDLGDIISGPGVTDPVDAAWSQVDVRVYQIEGEESPTGRMDWKLKLVVDG